MTLSADEKANGPLTPEEAAEYLKVTRRTIDRWIADGTMKASKIGRVVRIKRSEIVRLLEGEPAGQRHDQAFEDIPAQIAKASAELEQQRRNGTRRTAGVIRLTDDNTVGQSCSGRPSKSTLF